MAHLAGSASGWAATITRAVAGDAGPPEGGSFLPAGERGSHPTGPEELRKRLLEIVFHAFQHVMGLAHGQVRVHFDMELCDIDIARRAREIYLQAGRSRAMPPPSVSRYGIELTRQERELLVKWYEGALL